MIPLVTASEKGKGQTEYPVEMQGRCGVPVNDTVAENEAELSCESWAIEGDSPVGVSNRDPVDSRVTGIGYSS